MARAHPYNAAFAATGGEKPPETGVCTAGRGRALRVRANWPKKPRGPASPARYPALLGAKGPASLAFDLDEPRQRGSGGAMRMTNYLIIPDLRKIGLGAVAAMLIGLTAASAGAQSLPPLSEQKYINQTLLSAAIGEAIRQNCSTISARMFRALGKALALERHALRLGYSRAEIKAFISSKTEKQRMIDEVIVYLKAHGVVENQESTFCELGRQEIARNSLTGQLLRSRR